MTATVPPLAPDGVPGPDEGPTGPSGWHRDPWSRHEVRFFDGRLWTEHVADGGVGSIDSSPVADLPRSRPRPASEAPPAAVSGPRVVDGDGRGGERPDERLDAPLLLVESAPDGDGVRRLRTPDDVVVGRVVPSRAPLVARAGRLLVAAPRRTPTRLEVRDETGDVRLRLSRPGRRTEPTVDVVGPHGALGTIVAEAVRHDLRARVVAADGEQVGLLERPAGTTSSLRVTGVDGRPRARLTPVWDVPGSRTHLPPGVVLLDRRPPEGDPPPPGDGDLLLAAVLAPTLLAAPDPPVGD